MAFSNLKFSIGLSLETTPEEFLEIVLKYSAQVREIYFSPLILDIDYHTRSVTQNWLLKRQNILDQYYDVLKYIQSKGISLCYALNKTSVDKKKTFEALAHILGKDIYPDSIVCMGELGEDIKKFLPEIKLIYSFSNGIRTIADINNINPDIFSTIVFGGSTIRDFELIGYAKAKGFQTKLLLNNGCSFNCMFCKGSKTHPCSNIVEQNISRYDVDFIYALQSIMPWEFHEYYLSNENIDYFKISNRECSALFLQDTLGSYLYNDNSHFLERNASWLRLGSLQRFHNDFDLEKILMYKKNIWKHVLATGSYSVLDFDKGQAFTRQTN